MNKNRNEQSSLKQGAAVAAASILGAIVSIAVSIAFQVPPAQIDSAVAQASATTYA